MAWDTIVYEKIERTARVTLNRPEKRNAQNMQMIREIDEALKEAERDADVRVVVLRGAGKCFSSGHDLSVFFDPASRCEEGVDMVDLMNTIEGRMQLEQRMFYDKCMYVRNLPKPTIAQVHGYCWAAGLLIAAMCDIIYASEEATFTNPVVRYGASAGEILFEPWEFGPRFAKEMLFTGDVFSAQDAFRLGFVNKVVPLQNLEGEVLALARKIALTPPVAVSMTKASINRTLDLMGQSAAWREHFLVHEISHVTSEMRQIEKSRKQAGGPKEQFKDFKDRRSR